MLTQALDTTAELAVALLINYSFDLGGHTASELMNHWQKRYPVSWIHLAVIEALYQGRYKAVSVEQILAFWQRRGQALYHFNMEFERLVCSKFPQNLNSPATKVPLALEESVAQLQEISSSQLEDLGEDASPDNCTEPISRIDTDEDVSKPPLPKATTSIRPPIGQFTPEQSASSEVFTSKLKALANKEQGKWRKPGEQKGRGTNQ